MRSFRSVILAAGAVALVLSASAGGRRVAALDDGAWASSAWISATIVRSDRNIRRYLGITLFPQAGVALGMSLMAMALPGGAGETVRNITLFAVLIYELVGPVLTKIALTKAGEITPKATRVVSGDDDE